jgi:hypothetical protein
MKKSPPTTPHRQSDQQQHRRFVETARALECDEDKGRFEEKLKRIATAKPTKPKQKDH